MQNKSLFVDSVDNRCYVTSPLSAVLELFTYKDMSKKSVTQPNELRHVEPMNVGINGKGYRIGLLICKPLKKEVVFKFQYKDSPGYMQYEGDRENNVLRTLVDHITFHKDGTIHFKQIEPTIAEKKNIPNLIKKKNQYQKIKINPDFSNPFELKTKSMVPILVISIDGKVLELDPILNTGNPVNGWNTNQNHKKCSLLFWAVNDYFLQFSEGHTACHETFKSNGLWLPQYQPFLIPSAFETSPITMGTGVGTSIIVTFMLDIHLEHKKFNETKNDNSDSEQSPFYFFAAPSMKEIIKSYSTLGKEDREKQIDLIYDSNKNKERF